MDFIVVQQSIMTDVLILIEEKFAQLSLTMKNVVEEHIKVSLVSSTAIFKRQLFAGSER